MDIQTVSFVAGILFGSVAVVSACIVWLRHRDFGLGGSVLSLVGVTLIGLSLWSSVKIEVSKEGVSAEFQKLSERVDAMAQANIAVTQEVRNVAEASASSRQQMIDLARAVETAGQPESVAMARAVRNRVLETPIVDPRRLDSPALTFRRLEGKTPVRNPVR